jgi:DNA-directed RNA polymerase specialized sigma24 family protein
MPVALDTSPEALARMRRSLEALDHPVEFCRRYLRLRGFHRQARDFDDLLAVAVESLVKAGLSWHPRDEGGVAFTTWAYRYMDREVLRELRRDARRMADLIDEPVSDAWLAYDPATTPFRQVEDRAEIEDLMDRANLSDLQRYALWFSAVHASDGPPPEGHRPLGSIAKGSVHKTGVRRIRKVIAGDTLNDDWAAARATFRARFEVEAHQSAARYRDRLAAP